MSPLSFSEQLERNKDGEKKQLQHSDKALLLPLHGAGPTHSSHLRFVSELLAATQLQLQLPVQEVQKSVLTRERRKKAPGFEIGSSENCQESIMGML